MAILKIRDENGNVQEILAIKGEPGKSGTAISIDGSVVTDWNADTKVDKVTTSGSVLIYGVNTGGNQTMLNASMSAAKNSIPRADANGCISTKTPTTELHATNKAYVDKVVSNKTDVIQSRSGSVVTADNSAHTPLKGLKLFGKTVQNGTPTPEAPAALESAGASGNIGVTVAGKNLLSKASAGSKSSNGITFTSNGDGSYSAKGTAEKVVELYFPIEENCVIVDGLYEHLMNNVDTGHNAACLLRFSDGKNSSLAFTPANRIDAPTNHIGKTVTQIGVHVQSGATIDVTFSPMLVLSDTATDFEPYIAQTLTASTPNGLPGIPVSSGGNYTDENGQQWICDEIDFARGMYVQRVKQFVVDENTSFNKHSYTTDEYFVCYASNTGAAATKACISNLFINNVNANMLKTSACIYIQSDTKDPLHFSVPISIATGTTSFKNWAIENDLCVFYPLAEADYHELSTQELEVYAKLHTNEPNTTVVNDAGAGMEIAYYTPTTAVQMVHSPADAGKVLSIDEHGCVALKNLPTEAWTFTLEDGSTVTKSVVLK